MKTTTKKQNQRKPARKTSKKPAPRKERKEPIILIRPKGKAPVKNRPTESPYKAYFYETYFDKDFREFKIFARNKKEADDLAKYVMKKNQISLKFKRVSNTKKIQEEIKHWIKVYGKNLIASQKIAIDNFK